MMMLYAVACKVRWRIRSLRVIVLFSRIGRLYVDCEELNTVTALLI